MLFSVEISHKNTNLWKCLTSERCTCREISDFSGLLTGNIIVLFSDKLQQQSGMDSSTPNSPNLPVLEIDILLNARLTDPGPLAHHLQRHTA